MISVHLWLTSTSCRSKLDTNRGAKRRQLGRITVSQLEAQWFGADAELLRIPCDHADGNKSEHKIISFSTDNLMFVQIPNRAYCCWTVVHAARKSCDSELKRWAFFQRGDRQ